MQLHQLQRNTPNKKEKRVGRGGRRGKTSGRGTKGQNARAGHKKRPEIREQLKKLPKLRGYRMPSIQSKPTAVNIASLEALFSAGESVTPKILSERGLAHARRGKIPVVKILADGELSKKLVISGCAVSSAARAKIEKAGGTVAA
jgi:large subunit ribosomal protein L15